LNALPERFPAIGKRLSHAVANKELLMNKEDKPSRMKYVWPWLGFAALITAMWAVFAD
jgi:hypothetical protein